MSIKDYFKAIDMRRRRHAIDSVPFADTPVGQYMELLESKKVKRSTMMNMSGLPGKNIPEWERHPESQLDRHASAKALAPVVMPTVAWLVMTPAERVAACYEMADEFYKQSWQRSID